MDISKKKPKRLIGIEILRTFLCFRIVLLHYYSSNNNFINKLRKKNLFQVPCFFFISFYFFYPIISTKNILKMIMRLERLFIPYYIYSCKFIYSFILMKLNVHENRNSRKNC